MEWPGGYYEAKEKNLDPTTSTRRVRTFVHEVGHSLGLDHPSGPQLPKACRTVMASLEPDNNTSCRKVTKRDRDDMEEYWGPN